METQDESMSVKPVQQIFSAVDMVVAENGGHPGRNGFLDGIKKGAMELHGEREQVESLTGYCQQEISQLKEQIYRSHEEQLTRITEMVELKLKETTQRLEQQLGEEQATRSKAEKFVQMEQMKSINEIHKLRESLERAQREAEELRERTASDAILEMGKDRLKKKGKELYRLTLPSTPHGELLLAQGKQVPEDLETSPTHDDEGDREISSTHDEEDQDTLSSHDDGDDEEEEEEEEEAEEAAQPEIAQLQGEETTEETHLTQSEASRFARGRKRGRARWRAVVSPSDISPIPGGPIDESILIDFRSHVAHAIWGGQERKALKLQHHHRNLLEWDITKECKKVREKLQKSGLMNLKDYCFKYVDNVLISAFIERWQPETNTFHLPFGEMTITLDDVSHILGIPVEGRPVAGPGGNIPDLKIMELLTKGLGVTTEEAAKETKKASAVRMSWIRDHCKGTTEKSDDARVDACVRGYILYLFGCTVFSDKTGTKISVYHLQNLMEVDKIHTFSWGSAVLAYLYRQLGLASRAKVQHMSGCLTLLQTWIYEHFQLGRAIPQSSYDETMPRATRWQSKQGGGLKEASIEAIREQLDDISRTSVVWDPYKGHRQQHPLKDVAYFKGCLICYDVLEPNHPDRVLRQFGRVQLVPQPPSRPNTTSTHDYILLAGYLQNWVGHLLSVERRSVLVGDEWDCSSNYMSWYSKITHRFVQNPARRKSGEMRMEPEVLQDVEAPEDLGTLCMVELIDSSIKLLKHSFELGATVDKASFMNRERQAIKMLEAAQLLAEHKSKSKYDAVRLKRPSSTWEETEIVEPIQAKRPKPKRKNKKISALNR